MLGRASNIGDYVKRGEESGWIKISLRGNKAGETITITRKIDRQNKSEWQLNGMSRNIWFKIQFAYICTFSFILRKPLAYIKSRIVAILRILLPNTWIIVFNNLQFTLIDIYKSVRARIH